MYSPQLEVKANLFWKVFVNAKVRQGFSGSIIKKSFATRLEIKDQIMTFTNQAKAMHQLCMGDTLVKDLILATWHTSTSI